MADKNDYNTVRLPTDEENQIVSWTLRLFGELQSWRSVFAEQWEEISCLIYPESRNTFFVGSYNYPGQKNTDRMLDSTGMMALQRFAAIIESLVTPANSRWHVLSTTNPYLNRNRRVSLYFEQLGNILFQERYAQTANFMGSSYRNYVNLGAFGTHGMMVEELDDQIYGRTGLRYISVPLGELFLYEDHQGQICGFIRYFRLTAQQAFKMFGKDNFPESLRGPLEQGSQWQYEFLHHVCCRDDYTPGRLGPKGKPWRSDYISITGQTLLRQGGYRSFPLAVGRYTQAPREVYGRSPAMACLPSLKTANAIKGMLLKAGHRNADPVLLINDDGLIDSVDLRPGAINKGGVSADGRPLVHPLPVGSIQIGEEMLEREAGIVKDSFLVSLFDILVESPQRTATEIIERVQEKGILMAPMVGRQAEYLGPMIERELDILAWQKKLPPLPPELREARGEYKIEFTSPLNKAMRAGEAAGFMRTVESALAVVNATQDTSHLDVFDFDTALRDIADIQAVPESWMASDSLIKGRRQDRAKQQQIQQQIQAMPAQSAMLKAQAIVQKTQMQTGTSGPQGPGPGAAPPQGPGPGPAAPQQMGTPQ